MSYHQLRAKLPTTRVAADAPYHDKFPEKVTVSEFISSRAIEPFYDVLQELSDAGATISVQEMDQDVGSGMGPKGWVGPGCPNRPPPVQDREHYGLEEMLVTIMWHSGEKLKVSEPDLTITPILPTLAGYRKNNGSVKITITAAMRGTLQHTFTVAKPLFFEVLKSYQTVYPNWTAKDLFTHLHTRDRMLASTHLNRDNHYNDEDSDEEILGEDYRADPQLFDTIIVLDSMSEKVSETVNNRLILNQTGYVVPIKTGEYDYHYTVTIQALDLRANTDTLLMWLKPEPVTLT